MYVILLAIEQESIAGFRYMIQSATMVTLLTYVTFLILGINFPFPNEVSKQITGLLKDIFLEFY